MFEFFRFELRQQLRSPLLWLMALLFAILGLIMMSSEAVSVSGGVGNVHRNAPVPIAFLIDLMTLIGMLFVAMTVNGALLRDFECGVADLIFATPSRRRDYVGGRILAAMAMSFGIYLAMGVGMFIGQFMPWVDQATVGPVMLWPYAWSYAILVLPNLLLATAVLSLLAITTRSMLWVYVGVLGFIVLYFVSNAMLRNIDNVWIATLCEPLGIRALGRTIRYWSTAEQNTRLPELAGYLLANRALWLAIATGLLVACFALFKPQRTGTGGLRFGRWFGGRAGRGGAPSGTTTAPAAPATAARRPVAPPRATQHGGPRTAFIQFLRVARFDTASVLRGVPFIVMLLFGVGQFVLLASFSQTQYGVPAIPVTSQMLTPLQGGFGFLLILVVMFYAGELIGKERAAKLHEVTDAMPMPIWVPLAAKFAALLVVIVAFQCFGVLLSMLYQMLHGYTRFELGLYAQVVAMNTLGFAAWAALALALQVLCNNKFLGYAAVILVWGANIVLPLLDFTQKLYLFNATPSTPYSDMNGHGHFLRGMLWFQGYWLLFAIGLLLLSAAFWVRGAGGGGRERLRVARERLRGPLGAVVGAFAVAFLAVGGYLYWSVNIVNAYMSPDEQLDLRARYERDYRKYRHLPQPKIVAVSVDVDLRPETQTLHADGTYRIRNPHARPIPDLHVSMRDDLTLTRIDLGGAKLLHHDRDAGYRIYRLDRPLAAGEERDIRFRVDIAERGIANSVAQTEVVENGTFINNRAFPSFGYLEDAEIQDRSERRKRGLGEPHRVAKLEDEAARAHHYIDDDSDWIDFRTSICTAPDQIALSPGYLRREYVRDGRRCFDYAMDRPMLNFYSYLSARWKVKKSMFEGIPIEVYHDPAHPYNVDRMIESVRKSLAYYNANFAPYQHRQVRIIEFPGYGTFAQAFANTIPYSEAIGFITDLRDKPDIDSVFYVTAHEVAHQWWAHQVIGADVQGATVLSESLAQYSALMVMEHEYGRQHMRRFLKYELDQYLFGRSDEQLEEQPLHRNEGQGYIRYEKASLVFYRLREELGEEVLNRAIRKFLLAKRYQQAPYTTSQELLDAIRAEAGPQHETLIADLFEKISFYDNRVQEASATKRADGKYQVVLDLHAAKRYADGEGRETEGRLDDWIEVGVFARGPSGKERDEKPLYLQRHRITTKNPKITVVVDAEPYEAGFDPYNKLIDRVSSDNRKRITLDTAKP